MPAKHPSQHPQPHTPPPTHFHCATPQLIFAEEDMALDVGSLVVGGALRAGGPSCRLASRLTLTFHPVAGIDPLNMVRDARCFAVLQGLRGARAVPGWVTPATTRGHVLRRRCAGRWPCVQAACMRPLARCPAGMLTLPRASHLLP